ncbi:phage baseplate assembly protein V [Pantoea agglomerans]|uniref:phage baseplate assembly protein V n=1 Tax=Enterobacter agglomerans TaxID=549 RepID=UPI0013BB057E|nr:phage baseplate assembly protein V [Pantoea agglomerans]NEG58186.1 phage baseplate assembly protein V [Pantoea agglomerans]NEG99899.1 phage baseplate assembly protein V [Pantoea agglomerans]NEH04138.1 phage baseplate assembly protein V [Pantoea agglomerans]NEH14459.1 phage baseplate assembly protein V [Pantoea agglomerans]
MSMEYTLAEMWRRLNNMIRRGTVHSVQLKPPRVRVSFGTDPVNNTEHLSAWLPWYTRADSGLQEWSVPAEGCPATVLSEGGDLRNGVALVGLITDDQTPAGESGDMYVTRYGTGAGVSYDTAANAMAVSLPAGGTLSVTSPGGVDIEGDVNIKGGLTATTVSDEKGSMQQMRDVHNDHDHQENGDGGGTTNPPNQKM